MGSRTRANPKPIAALNILFLNDANPKHQVRCIEELSRQALENDMRVQGLFPYIEKLVKNTFKFPLDSLTLEVYKVRRGSVAVFWYPNSVTPSLTCHFVSAVSKSGPNNT
jgi:hypothetical protein